MILVFGIREESWPKGCGYLYIKRGPQNPEERLCDLVLNDFSEIAVTLQFRRALERVFSAMGYPHTELRLAVVRSENISAIGLRILNAQLREFGMATAIRCRST
jgi:hypothetical protein